MSDYLESKYRILALQKAAIVLKGLADSFQGEQVRQETLCLSQVCCDAVNELLRAGSIQGRINDAIEELGHMIDGGEECRGRDSEISNVIRILDGSN